MSNARLVLLLLIGILPSCWLKRVALRRWFGWQVDESAWIGISIFMNVRHAQLGPGSYIGHLNVFRHLLDLKLDEQAVIGRWNWITGSELFLDVMEPGSPGGRFILGSHSGLTLRHYISCAGGVEIGAFTTMGGIRSTIFSHQLDTRSSRQTAWPVKIGNYCLITSDVRIAPGACIPDRCVIAMGSVVVGELPEAGMLYGGVPARPLKKVDDGAYFHRDKGFVGV